METFYYEAYNQPNVRLIDLTETPIERITESGLKTTEETFEFDMIIYATGFNAGKLLCNPARNKSLASV
jgi:cation diffusion facilitator CzcD-associated flavoprotein CzcO